MKFIITLLFATTSLIASAQLVPYEELKDKYLYKSMEEALNDPTNVIRLELKKADLHRLDLEFSRFVNLQWIDLSKNEFTDFPQALTKMEFLQYIDLSNNEIKDIPDEISNLSNLRYLNLERNRVYLISPEIGKLKKLEELQLMDNPADVFPEEMAGMASLKKLDVRMTKLDAKERRTFQKLFPYTKIKFSKTCDCD